MLMKWGSIDPCQFWLLFGPRLVLLHKPARLLATLLVAIKLPWAVELGLPRIVACCGLQRRLEDRHVALADPLNQMASVRASDLNS